MRFNVGDFIGPYQIVEQLGQGGMATVYKAYQSSLDRFVAIKVMHPSLNEEQTFIARFKREARLIARLDHPNIVSVHDFAEQDHSPYLVMKFIQGETLKDRLWKGPLSSLEIADVLNAVGSALNYAHQQGILHRDVKPSNVLISNRGHVYLADFGLARIAVESDSTLSSDSIVGTPQYISPEQALGKRQLDEGTDIYSFGVMLYEMVVGRVPFNADTPFSIIYDHIYTPLPMPRSINPLVPEGVEQVLLKALAKERADRYKTAQELVDAFKFAWEEAGVPMQGTAILLRSGAERTPSGGNPPRTGSTPSAASGSSGGVRQTQPGASTGSGTGSQPRVAPKRSKVPWLMAGGGVFALVCCVVVASMLGLLNGFNPITPPTATPQFTFCSGAQTWLQRDYFPKDEIAYCWAQAHYITSMAYDGSQWMVIMSKGLGYTDQEYLVAPNFPAEKVKEYWDKGFDITGLYYGKGNWYVVMSQGAGFTNQSYIVNSTLSDADIQRYWDKGYSITALGYGNGTWAVAMSSGANLGTQTYFTDASFPEEKIRNYWDNGYDITSVAYDNSVWVVVMSNETGFSNQYYYHENAFPEEGVVTDWNNDFSISNISFGNALWIVVMSKPWP